LLAACIVLVAKAASDPFYPSNFPATYKAGLDGAHE
jgi:hypothetical protein